MVGTMDSVVIFGTPKEVGDNLSQFLKEKLNRLTIHAFSQSQSTSDDGIVCVTATLIYTLMDKTEEQGGLKREEVGFRKEIEEQITRERKSNNPLPSPTS